MTPKNFVAIFPHPGSKPIATHPRTTRSWDHPDQADDPPKRNHPPFQVENLKRWVAPISKGGWHLTNASIDAWHGGLGRAPTPVLGTNPVQHATIRFTNPIGIAARGI